MCEMQTTLMSALCSTIIKPCLYKPQTVPICPFSNCRICQPKPHKCCCINKVCLQGTVPPPFPFDGDPCPSTPSPRKAPTRFTKSSPCLRKNNHLPYKSYIKMLEVHPVGRYVKLYNSSYNRNECIAGWYLIQYCYGSPLSVYKFNEDATIPPQFRVKIWSKCSDPGWLRLPTDHTFNELCFWKAGSGITTALYSAQGKPITWICGLEKFEPGPCYVWDAGMNDRAGCQTVCN